MFVLARTASRLAALVLLVVGAACPAATNGFEGDGAPIDPVDPPDGEARFFHFDVGQADATLITAPGATVLIDAGDWRNRDVVPHLRDAGVTAIDLMILTHPHADHIGQVPAILDEFPVTEVWMSGWEHESQTFDRAVSSVLASNAGYHEPRAGERQRLRDLVVEVLHPVAPLRDVHDNLAVRVRFGNFAAIYTGDAEVEHEADMIDRHADLRAQLLQLGHHGSRTSTSRAFLEAIRPEVAIYSAAVDSQYNHPHAEVVNRVQGLGIPLYGTATSGTIVVITDGVGFRIEELGAAAGRGEVELDEGESELAAAADQVAECIDLNRAPEAELAKIVHTGPARARQIIELRPFDSVADLQRVRGLGEARVRDIEEEGLACVR
jgi:competence protein ComEC